MVRDYEPKTVKTYTQSDLDDALEAVRDGKLKPKAAAEQFKIPLSTIYARLSGKRGSGPRGARPILTMEEEGLLVQTIETFERWQLPLLRQDVISIARS